MLFHLAIRRLARTQLAEIVFASQRGMQSGYIFQGQSTRRRTRIWLAKCTCDATYMLIQGEIALLA